MKIAVLPRRRLLALCGLSAALHLLVLQLIARHGAREAPLVPGGAAPLVLRLAPEPAPEPALKPSAHPERAPAPHGPAHAPARAARSPAPSPAQPPVRARPASVRSAASPPAAPDPAPVPAVGPEPARDPDPSADPGPGADAASMPAAPASAAAGASAGGSAPFQIPARYRVRMPPSARLVYRLTRRDAAGHAAPAGSARLDWRNDGGHYTLEMDGLLGQVSSHGVDSDNGIQPQRFTARRAGRREDVAFDPDRGRTVFADGAEAPDAPGTQDRASLLMQLAGIGLARPGQLQDVIEVVVADAGAARVERFQVLGEEQVDTGMGPMPALHLTQLAAPGEGRLQLWLAPGLGWMPVRLRLTEAGGASATQVLARSEPAAH